MSRLPYIFLILLIIPGVIFSAGCIQNRELSQVITPEPDTMDPIRIEITPDTRNDKSPIATIPPVMDPPEKPSSQPDTAITPEPTVIVPTQLQTPSLAPPPAPTKPDPLIVFRDRTILLLDELKAGKEGILAAYKSGDMVKVKDKATEYSLTIRKNAALKDVPLKMDYVKVNYHEYADRAGQFAQSFEEGATMWMTNDKNSANSLFDAGIIASERADIADKRIRVFLQDQVRH
jgi:hypothetical protein